MYAFGQVAFDPAYKPAVFTDPARLEKIKRAFPTIEKIYKEHAAKNNFPGIASVTGIVVLNVLPGNRDFARLRITRAIWG